MTSKQFGLYCFGAPKQLPPTHNQAELDHYYKLAATDDRYFFVDEKSYELLPRCFAINQTNISPEKIQQSHDKYNQSVPLSQNQSKIDKLNKINQGLSIETKEIKTEQDLYFNILKLGNRLFNQNSNQTTEVTNEDIHSTIFTNIVAEKLKLNIKEIKNLDEKIIQSEAALANISSDEVLNHLKIVEPAVSLIEWGLKSNNLQPVINNLNSFIPNTISKVGNISKIIKTENKQQISKEK